MKSYTNIEQSKKLAEILPIESADMYYEYVLPRSNKLKHIPSIGNPVDAFEWYNSNKGYTHFGKEPLSLKEYCIPCWSLAALLNILPQKYYPIKDHETNLILGKPKDKWCVLYWDATGMQDGEQTLGDSPIDACVEMIYKLKESDLL